MFHVEHDITMYKYTEIANKYTENVSRGTWYYYV